MHHSQMPKSTRPSSPPFHASANKSVANATTSLSTADSIVQNVPPEIAIKKKKNADAQAAFRARRANYIATLEETGKSILLITITLISNETNLSNISSFFCNPPLFSD